MGEETESRLYRFYSTDVAPCPYLAGRQERRLVALVERRGRQARLDLLTEARFPAQSRLPLQACLSGLPACVPVRIVVDGFRPGRSFRRVLTRNADLSERQHRRGRHRRAIAPVPSLSPPRHATADGPR